MDGQLLVPATALLPPRAGVARVPPRLLWLAWEASRLTFVFMFSTWLISLDKDAPCFRQGLPEPPPSFKKNEGDFFVVA